MPVRPGPSAGCSLDTYRPFGQLLARDPHSEGTRLVVLALETGHQARAPVRYLALLGDHHRRNLIDPDQLPMQTYQPTPGSKVPR